jgi:hypothetical protein
MAFDKAVHCHGPRAMLPVLKQRGGQAMGLFTRTKRRSDISPGTAPAGWYLDRPDSDQLRYFDGTQWTDHYAPNPRPASAASGTVAVGRTDRAPERTATPATGRPNANPSLLDLLDRLQLEAPRHPLDEQVEVAGETYHVKGIKKLYRERSRVIADVGCTLEDEVCTLVPEPWNPHDNNAVAVMIGRHHVGYLPADLAVDYAAGLAGLASRGLLATGEARIWAKSDGGVVRARVTLLIPEADVF